MMTRNEAISTLHRNTVGYSDPTKYNQKTMKADLSGEEIFNTIEACVVLGVKTTF